MIKFSTLAALALLTMIGAAQASINGGGSGGFGMPNGVAFNGMKLNGMKLNGVALVGVPAISALGAHLISVDLPATAE
jgi:hypothetical protein